MPFEFAMFANSGPYPHVSLKKKQDMNTLKTLLLASATLASTLLVSRSQAAELVNVAGASGFVLSGYDL